jgi:hypothetical protein
MSPVGIASKPFAAVPASLHQVHRRKKRVLFAPFRQHQESVGSLSFGINGLTFKGLRN